LGDVPLRIKQHPILDFDWSNQLSFTFNDKSLIGYASDTIASALHANNVKIFSESLKYGAPRGFFCGIGKCSSCLMEVNGVPNVRTCIAPLTQDVSVHMQDRIASWPQNRSHKIPPLKTIDVDVLVVGAGPAGMEAALQAAELGATVLLVDENQHIGGQLTKQTHKFFGSKQEKAGIRGIAIAKELEANLHHKHLEDTLRILLDSTVFGLYEGNKKNRYTFGVAQRQGYKSQLLKVTCRSVIFAIGAMENMLLFPGNDLPGVYGAGAVQTLMNVYGVKPGKKVLMVGAGNVGLIVSYQLLQAGIEVDRVVEAAPLIGGYHVHAAKLCRCGVPIHTRHSIQSVFGESSVEGAIVSELDERWQPITGTEETIACDTVCLAVGLTPSTRLLEQLGACMATVPEAGGYVALHNRSMETTIPCVFVAGDASGIEEASTAMIEGKIAGISAAKTLGYNVEKAEVLQEECRGELIRLRGGPFGIKPRLAKQKIEALWESNHAQV
jgi:sarcosine oxidase subunit alpha